MIALLLHACIQAEAPIAGEECPEVIFFFDGDGDEVGVDDATVEACEPPRGYAEVAGDCDDADPSILATRTWFVDADGDGYGDEQVEGGCDIADGQAEIGGDCDDEDPSAFPGNPEICDDVDNDCNGDVDDDPIDGAEFYLDQDGDDYGDEPIQACGPGDGIAVRPGDCNDADAEIHPGADEHCDGIDEDCDTDIDENALDETTWYVDLDGDGWGADWLTGQACEQPDGWVAVGGDCDDGFASVNPGAIEVCNGLDDDCDGSVDIDAADASTWYADLDGDGYGDPASARSSCVPSETEVATSDDCDDADATAHPGGTELCGGGDEDCDGDVDTDATDAPTWYADADGDGYGDASTAYAACVASGGDVENGDDCDEGDADVSPDAIEVCNDVDDDCDGEIDVDATDASTWYADVDGDGYGEPETAYAACVASGDDVDNGEDCDDGDATVNPAATEACNGLDDDCDGDVDEGYASGASTWYADADGDGYGDPAVTASACDPPSGYVADGTDCEDTDGAVNPGASEFCNDVDDDCDLEVDEGEASGSLAWYADVDEDGYGDAASSVLACDAPSGYLADATDCDDSDEGVSPGASERCDARDEDCDGVTDEGACPGYGFWDEDGRAYFWLYYAVTDWSSSVTECAGYGYHLFTVGSSDESEWLVSQLLVAADLVNGAGTWGALGMWMGASSDGSGAWSWIDGAAWSYTDWAAGEPNGTSTCAYFWMTSSGDTSWYDDATCSSPGSMNYVCEAG